MSTPNTGSYKERGLLTLKSETEGVLAVAMSQTQYFGEEEMTAWNYAWLIQECFHQMATLYHFNPQLEIPTGLEVQEQSMDGWKCLLMFAHTRPAPEGFHVVHRRFSPYFDLMPHSKPNVLHHSLAMGLHFVAVDYVQHPPVIAKHFNIIHKVELLDHQFIIEALRPGLAACPFCGHDKPTLVKRGNSIAHFVVVCGNCRAEMKGTLADAAIDGWNLRKPF